VAQAAIVVPAPGLDPAFHGHLLALAEELATGLGEPVPRDGAVLSGYLRALRWSGRYSAGDESDGSGPLESADG